MTNRICVHLGKIPWCVIRVYIPCGARYILTEFRLSPDRGSLQQWRLETKAVVVISKHQGQNSHLEEAYAPVLQIWFRIGALHY